MIELYEVYSFGTQYHGLFYRDAINFLLEITYWILLVVNYFWSFGNKFKYQVAEYIFHQKFFWKRLLPSLLTIFPLYGPFSHFLSSMFQERYPQLMQKLFCYRNPSGSAKPKKEYYIFLIKTVHKQLVEKAKYLVTQSFKRWIIFYSIVLILPHICLLSGMIGLLSQCYFCSFWCCSSKVAYIEIIIFTERKHKNLSQIKMQNAFQDYKHAVI